MLLRGHDTFYLWCPSDESVEETLLLHEVYADVLEYREFLDEGEPVTFQVPDSEGPVVSALRLGNRILVRRTDFNGQGEPEALRIGESQISVPRIAGTCQIIALE